MAQVWSDVESNLSTDQLAQAGRRRCFLLYINAGSRVIYHGKWRFFIDQHGGSISNKDGGDVFFLLVLNVGNGWVAGGC